MKRIESFEYSDCNSFGMAGKCGEECPECGMHDYCPDLEDCSGLVTED